MRCYQILVGCAVIAGWLVIPAIALLRYEDIVPVAADALDPGSWFPGKPAAREAAQKPGSRLLKPETWFAGLSSPTPGPPAVNQGQWVVKPTRRGPPAVPKAAPSSGSRRSAPDLNGPLRGVYFARDATDSTPISQQALENLAGILKGYPEIRIEIQGHTDPSGDAGTDERISHKRAENISYDLVSKGISPSRLTTAGFGTDSPVAENSTEADRARNRRIELKVLEAKAVPDIVPAQAYLAPAEPPQEQRLFAGTLPLENVVPRRMIQQPQPSPTARKPTPGPLAPPKSGAVPHDPPPYYKEAMAAISKGATFFPEAENLLDFDPLHAWGLLIKARASRDREYYLPRLEEARLAYPDIPELYQEIALELFLDGKTEKALSTIGSGLVGAQPDHPMLNNLRCYILRTQAEKSSGPRREDLLTQALQAGLRASRNESDALPPNERAACHYNLGMVYRMMGKRQEAFAECRIALERDKGHLLAQKEILRIREEIDQESSSPGKSPRGRF